MSSSKIERAMHGPSWTEVIVGAALSVVLGAFLAGAHLILKPVLTVKELPKEPVDAQVYFIEGKKDANKGRAWLQKQQALREGRSIELTEDELNTAVATPTEKPKNGEAAAPSPSSDVVLAPGSINFRIVGNELQIALPVKVMLLGTNVIVQARGSFVRSGESFRFVPSSFFIGSCPIHRLPLVEGLVLRRLNRSQSVPEDLSAAWSKLTAVEIEDKLLKLTM